MWSLLFAGLMAVILFAAPVNTNAGGCEGPGCTITYGSQVVAPAPRVDVKVKVGPTRAWRYAWAKGHRASVVRLTGLCPRCNDYHKIGSGVVVHWGGKVLVVTAQHVAKGAKEIHVVLASGARISARVIAIDNTWDCAVLRLRTETGWWPEGYWPKKYEVQPAEVEVGPSAAPNEGDRLESLGYGGDGELASNTGMFLGYRFSERGRPNVHDWMLISGHARPGDSGGPVFNRRGKLIGILWGRDNKRVFCVQPGRLHLMLNKAAESYEQLGVYTTRPTPPSMGPLVPVPQPGKKPILPWRGEAEKRHDATDARLDALLAALEKQVSVQVDKGRVDVDVAPHPIPPPVISEPDRSPLLGGLVVLVGIAVAFVIYFAGGKASGEGI